MKSITEALRHASCVRVYLEYTRDLRAGIYERGWKDGTSTDVDVMFELIDRWRHEG